MRRGRSIAEAVRAAVFHSGGACAVTSLILSAGFALQILSSFPGLRILGALGCAILLAAMVAELFLTPALFAMFGNGIWEREARGFTIDRADFGPLRLGPGYRRRLTLVL